MSLIIVAVGFDHDIKSVNFDDLCMKFKIKLRYY